MHAALCISLQSGYAAADTRLCLPLTSSAHLIHLPCCAPPVQISAFFPGHHAKAMQQNAEMRKMEEEVQGLLAGRSLVCMSTGYA